MRKHVLPGEQGHSEWFDRLNPFEQQETLRQVAFKRRRWPGLADGVWAKKGSECYTYPHILPEGHGGSLYQGIAGKVLEYCKAEGIAIHSEFLNLRSSQACCFNVLFPCRLDMNLAKAVLEPVLPSVREVSKIEFEYTGPEDDGATEWLSEPAGGQRGQNRTSIDTAVWWTDGVRRLLTFIEWKYTEKGYGTCGGYASSGNKKKQHCRDFDISRDDPVAVCYVVYGKNRRYWERLEDAHIDLSAFSGLKGCPFKGPFYQLMRQYLLAAYCRKQGDVEEVYVVSVGFGGNSSLHGLPPDHKTLGVSVENGWNKCRKNVPPLRHVDVQTIVDRAKASPLADRTWIAYLNDRYGL